MSYNYKNILGVQTIEKLLHKNLGHSSPSLSDLHHLFRLIGVTNSINNLLIVLKYFSKICSEIETVCIDHKWEAIVTQFTRAKKTSNAILGERKALARKISHIAPPLDMDSKNYFRGDLTSSPLYTIIGTPPKNRAKTPHHQRLLAQVLISIALVQHYQMESEFNRPIAASLDALRDIASGEEEYPLLPDNQSSTDDYLSLLVALNPDGSLASITRFIERSLQLIQCFTLKELANIVWEKDKNQGNPFDIIKALNDNIPPKSYPKLYENIDSDEEDDASPYSPALNFIFPQKSTPRMVPDLYLRIARAVANARAMENQLFFFHWNHLNQHDTQTLLDFLSSNEIPLQNEVLGVKIMLEFMLLFGMSSERVAAVQIHAEQPEDPEGDRYITSSRTLQIYSPGPRLKTKLPDQAFKQATPKKNNILLPIPERLFARVNAYITQASRTPLPSLFGDRGDEISALCIRALNKLNRQHGTRLTTTRISKYLQRELAHIYRSDIANASLVLGKKIFLARTKIHYSCFAEKHLQNIYHLAASQLLREPLIIKSAGETQSYALGTPRRPILDCVRTLIKSLTSIIVGYKSTGVRTREALIEYHNAYMLYTIVMINYSTGFRAVNAPYIYENMYDSETGFCIIRDKDSSDFYHSRLVWLIKACRDQLNLFDGYLRKFYHQNCEIPPERKLPPFFLSESGETEIATKSRIESELEKHRFYLPGNCQRHFLKSILQERGCLAEFIELMLGHWHAGEEGWNQNSGIHPWDYRCAIKKYLQPLTEELGLKKQEGAKTLPGKVKFKISSDILNYKKKRTNQQNNKPLAKPTEILKHFPPSQIWLEPLGKSQKKLPIHKAFKRQEQIVLLSVKKHLPEIYSDMPQPTLDSDKLHKFIKKLESGSKSPQIYYKRLDYLIKVLEIGKSSHGWPIGIPPRPIFLPKAYNFARPSLIQHIKIYRQEEKKFLDGMKSSIPADSDASLVQIIQSSIMYGGIHSQKWLGALLRGLKNNLYQTGEMMWIDLFIDPEITNDNKSQKQRNPSEYRRWIADPATQILITRWLKDFPQERKKIGASSVHELWGKHSENLVSNEKAALPKLSNLLPAANAWLSLHAPPFLAAYAANQVQSTSLPDAQWLRLITGQNYPTVSLAEKTKEKQPEESTAKKSLNSTDSQTPQSEYFKALRRIIKIGDRSTLVSQIQNFLNQTRGQSYSFIELLGQWAQQLLSRAEYEAENRIKVEPEKPSTVDTYLGTFGEKIIALGDDIDLRELEEDELTIFLVKLANVLLESQKAKNPQGDGINQRFLYNIDRLNQFLGYLESFHDLPSIRIAIKEGKINAKRTDVVRANIVTEQEYFNVLKHLGWKEPHRTRQEKMTFVATILAYRAGLRVMEIAGLQVEDIQGSECLEVLIRVNEQRGIKSSAAERRIPLYILLPEEELLYIKQWHQFRCTEIGTTLKSPLFTMNSFETVHCSENVIFAPLRQALKEITNDISVVPHTLRHSFATLLLLKISLRSDIDLGNVPIPGLKNFSFEEQCRFKQALLGKTTSGRNILYAIASLLGHTETSTELKSYIHLCDWLMWHYLRHPSCCPPASVEAIINLTGISRATVFRSKAAGCHLLLNPKKYDGKSIDNNLKISLSHPMQSRAEPPVEPHIFKRYKSKIPNLDQALIKLRSTPIASTILPASKIEFWLLDNLYNRLRGVISEKGMTIPLILENLLAGYKNYDLSFVFDKPKEGKHAVDYFKLLGMDFSIYHQPSRWSSPERKKESFSSWEKKLGIPIQQALTCCGRNLEMGSIKISISEIRVLGYRVQYDKQTAKMITLLLQIASQYKRQRRKKSRIHSSSYQPQKQPF